ncbi:MAG: LysM peptidoglycan-binding domain-containing protein [Spirochaetota bacterium]
MKRFVLTLLMLLGFLVAAATEDRIHVLQRGETIYTLARRYDVSAELILEHNDISDPTRLAVGTRLRIPEGYVVQPGEYIYSIARKLGVSWLELLEANGLDGDDVVRPGDVLVIPGGASVATDRTGDGRTTERREDPAAPREQPGDASGAAVGRAPIEWPHPGARTSWDGKFPGIVMQGSVGDEFRSVTAGAVEFVGPFSSFGKLILVRSENGFLYGYAGADRVIVASGDRVSPGTVLGTVGYSPAFDSAMVLFTVWRNNRYVDPTTAPRS